MADYDFENPTFDSYGPGINDDHSFLPYAIMTNRRTSSKSLSSPWTVSRACGVRLESQSLKTRKSAWLISFIKKLTVLINCAPTVSTISSLELTPTAKHSSGLMTMVTKSLSWRHGGNFGFWRYQHWSRGTERVAQMHCGDRWGSPVAHMVALIGGEGSAPAPAPKPPDKNGLKEWVKKHLQALGRALANLAGKAAAALPGIIGSTVSWLLSTLGKTKTWLAEYLWALAIAMGTLLLVAARDWLARQ